MKATLYIILALAFHIGSGQNTSIYLNSSEAPVVFSAAELLSQDFEAVLDAGLSIESTSPSRAAIVAKTDKKKFSKDAHEAFIVKVSKKKLKIFGSDPRGTAYGIMEISRLLEVSPWVFWADAAPQKKESFELPAGLRLSDAPAVPYRGIFINDEDWDFMPWASQTQGRPKGEIGPEGYGKVFQLMLRLRANTFWPAMHDCSKAFYTVEGNREIADRYGIIISTSHCEPMMCNANGEWREWAEDPSGRRYNYITDKELVLKFWRERLQMLKGSDCIYTLGMRGIHDGQMFGTKTVEDQVVALRDVLKEQRRMLEEEVGDVKAVPQQFVPYKEVLDAYNAGLEIPEDVTLIWCDDNYGYIRHFPTEAERARSGGNGIYYHISYWGRPHDYLWLSTTHPELIRSEMMRGYDSGIDRIWILNVGGIKPAEFNISLFLEMAWNPERFRTEDSVWSFCNEWFRQQTGRDADWAGLWKRYYDLAFSFRPEWMGGTRTEESDPDWKRPHDLPLNAEQIDARLAECAALSASLESVTSGLQSASVFELATYPVRCQVLQNIKWLNAQKARHGLSGWKASHDAYKEIAALTEQYNNMLDGKWKLMMDFAPRGLADYSDPVETQSAAPMPKGQEGRLLYRSASVAGTPLDEAECIEIPFTSSQEQLSIELHTLPVHPDTDGGPIRYTVSLDGKDETTVEFHTEGRSEEWKLNVLYNRAVRTVGFNSAGEREHTLSIKPVDKNIRLEAVYLK